MTVRYLVTPGKIWSVTHVPTYARHCLKCICLDRETDRSVLGIGVISHQSMRIHINAGRRWFWENTHQRGNYTSELAKHHVDAGFRSTQQIGQSAGFVVDAVVYSTFGGISR